MEHVNYLIMNNITNYFVYGKILINIYTIIFWTPYAYQYIDLILEDIGKLNWVKEIVDQATSITKFIYNKVIILSMMRRFMDDMELLHQGII